MQSSGVAPFMIPLQYTASTSANAGQRSVLSYIGASFRAYVTVTAIPMCQISLSILIWLWNKVLFTFWKFNQSAILPYYRQMVLSTWNDFLANVCVAQISINLNIIHCLMFTEEFKEWNFEIWKWILFAIQLSSCIDYFHLCL